MSRVKKFKDYRNSLQNSGEDVLKTQINSKNNNEEDLNVDNKPTNTESLSTLSVSYDQIMEAANEVEEKQNIQKDIERKANKIRIIKIVLIVLLCLLVIGGIVAAGILVF